jgi:aminodeoxyfutalosine deaminase
MRFLTADYVFPIFGAPVAGGILVVDEDGTIVDLLDPGNLDHEISGLEKYEGFLCPGFINSHCHLELSWAKGLIHGHGLDHFLKDLDALRKDIQPEQEIAAISREGDAMLKRGIVGVGDISNGLATLAYKGNSKILFHTFAEVFGSDPLKAGPAFERVTRIFDSFGSAGRNNCSSITPHATYSLSPELFRQIAVHASENSLILSIHHQESEEENRYFMDGSGPIAERRKFFNPGIVPIEPTGKRPIESISGFFKNNQPLMLVHNTVSQEQDIAFAESYFEKIYWCLCPNANLFIENKLPDIELFRKRGTTITLGTDSLASNSSLSILEEIKTIQGHFPGIPLCELLRWATQNGAEALGFNHLGTFEKGKKPGVILIKHPDIESLCLLPESNSSVLIMHGHDSLY